MKVGWRGLTAAFPPASRTLRPHLAARGWVHAIIPSVLWTTLLLLGKVMNAGTAVAYTELRFTGILNLGKVGTGGIYLKKLVRVW